MKFSKIKKTIFFIPLILQFFCSFSFSYEYKGVIDKFFSNRKIDIIEGIWVKTFANQGPPGCVTIFYKDQGKIFQIHIDKCFVMGKITGRHKKISNNSYEGENAIYFYDGKINWEPSSIKVKDDLNTFFISHGSYDNTFKEKWKRIWPKWPQLWTVL